MDAPPPATRKQVLAGLWQHGGLPGQALAHAELPGAQAGPVLPSHFDVTAAAQASLAAAALAAAELWHLRTGQRQHVGVAAEHAALECCAHFALNGQVPPLWDPLSGLYPCADGWVRVHANFAHHRDAALRVLGLPAGAGTPRAAAAAALAGWPAVAFEDAVAAAGGVAAAARSFEQWDAHPQGQALAAAPPLCITRLGDASPLPWPAATPASPPLAGLRVLDLTRILAGPAAARLLAAYGADVLMVNGPHLPNIEAIADLSRGKLSCQLDLRDPAGLDRLLGLADSAHVFLQGYRPGALAARGLSPQALAQRRPGLVVGTLTAYGDTGPWAGRRGFDSLVQTASGFNLAEAAAAGSAKPQALPMQVLDYGAGHLLALGLQAALHRQHTQGGSWHVRVSLAGVGQWLRSLPRVPGGLLAQAPPFEPYLETTDSGFGRLTALRHAAQFSRTPARWLRPAMPPGSHPPAWPG